MSDSTNIGTITSKLNKIIGLSKKDNLDFEDRLKNVKGIFTDALSVSELLKDEIIAEISSKEAQISIIRDEIKVMEGLVKEAQNFIVNLNKIVVYE